jgi:alpha-galactosidase
MKTTKIFGRPLAAGPAVYDDGRARVEALVEPVKGGFKVTGTVRGRAGTIEIFRRPAPGVFLMNNWQSWGPMQKTSPGGRLIGLDERMTNYSRYVFTPIPDVFARHLVSDYVVGWEEGLAGFLSSKIAHPYFVVESEDLAGRLEFFDTVFDEAVPLEPLLILEGTPLEQLYEEYAVRVAVENNVRVRPWNPVGWSSWYQYFTNLTLADVEKNIRLARRDFPFEVFQVDDGFEADIGDWLEVKPGFCGLPDLAGLIGGSGFHPGLWTAPFSIAETSRLYENHPEWVVAEAGRAKRCYRGWKKEIFALDTTHPGAQNWLFETFALLRRMGFDYFKIDFLFSAAMEGERWRRVTPIQAYREGMASIRQAVGESFILGCGAPLLPSVGLVDGMRVGEDTAPFWNPGLSGIQGANAYWALKNSVLRSFMHKKWWLNDPDCLLLRRQDTGLAAHEVGLYARTAGALDAMIIESDDLELVDENGRELLREAVRLRGGQVRVRGLLEDDFYLIDSWGGPSGIFRYAANLSEAVRIAGGREIPPRSGAFVKP